MDSSKDVNSIGSILKNTSVFGGVQILQILINLVRGKFIALFLGPDGIGINALYVSATNTIQQLASCGINLSIVKEVAARQEDELRLKRFIGIATKLIMLTALFGVALCIVFSPALSKFTFGNYDYTLAFVLLSAMVFFSIAGGGYLSILQGLHYIKIISKASVVSSLTGLIIGVPFYYLWGLKGIIPALIISSLSLFVFYYLSFRKTSCYNTISVRLKDHRPVIINVFKLGAVLVVSSLIGSMMYYFLYVFIREHGAAESVGYFQSANSITNQYVGMVFTAMSLEYFPRLASCAEDNQKISELVNRQIIVVCNIAAPLVCILITTAPIVIRLLLTEEFTLVIPLIRWLALGLIFRAAAYPLGYITFAKGNKKRFFWLEGIMGNAIYFIVSVVLYYLYGLVGLGIGLSIIYFITFVILYIVNHIWYQYDLSSKVMLQMIASVLICALCLLVSSIPDIVLSYISMIAISSISVIMAYNSLKKANKA